MAPPLASTPASALGLLPGLGGLAQAELCRAGPGLASADAAWLGRVGARMVAADDQSAAGGTSQDGITGAYAGDASGQGVVSNHPLGNNGRLPAAAASGGDRVSFHL